MRCHLSRTSLFLVILLVIVLTVISWEHWINNWTSLNLSAAAYNITWKKLSNSLETRPVTKPPLRHATVAETPMPPLSIKFFKKSPRWDFDEVYDRDASSRETTCRQTLRNSSDDNFKKAFIPDIRLFMYKDSINISKWNQLSHFNNPFGFMEYNHREVMHVVNMIPKPTEPLVSPKPGSDGCIRCAVVGTAGILNGSKMGREIDSHDYVFRMNGAVIGGYEDDVGSRTSVYVHTAHSISTSRYLWRKYGYTSVPTDEDIKFVLIPELLRDYVWLRALIKGEKITNSTYRNMSPRTYYGGKYNESRLYVVHPDFFRYVRNRFLTSQYLNASYWSIVRPTNGAFTIFLALQTCDIVDAYGFMTENYMKFSNYYADNEIRKVIFYSNHDYILEMRTWKNLHLRKILKLYQRTDRD